MPRRRWFRTPLILTTLLVTAVTGAVVSTTSGTAYAANAPTPGTFKGLGFDQCNAPSQSAMSAWRAHSPFRAAGIYVSGNSRACRTQTNLTASWVSTQLAAGWKLLPITLGPQASCSSRFPRYGRSIDPVINASTTSTYAAARTQGAAEARKTVAAAKALGLVPGSTMFYDIEAWNTSASSACNWSALYFLSAWTTQLHSLGYASGVYSSAASGMKLLDAQRQRTGNPIVMPDQVWIADWNGRATVASSYISSTGWMPSARVHQYQGGHDETWGGVRINIDRNYLDLTQPVVSGSGGSTGSGTPAKPPYTGSSTSDPACTSSSISATSYAATSATKHTQVTALQCLLKQRLIYKWQVTGTWNDQTTSSVRIFQRRVGHGITGWVSASDWVSLLAAGNSRTVLRAGATGADVTRVQRALNAAGTWRLTVSGRYDAATANAVGAYQKKVGIPVTKVVGTYTWRQLEAGRR